MSAKEKQKISKFLIILSILLISCILIYMRYISSKETYATDEMTEEPKILKISKASTVNLDTIISQNTEQLANKEEIYEKQEELEYRRQVEAAKQKAYHDAYIQDLKNRGYKIKYKKSFKDYLAGIITIAVIILVFIILWYIPPTHNWFVSLYESNPIIKIIVDIFRSFIHTITSIFE